MLQTLGMVLGLGLNLISVQFDPDVSTALQNQVNGDLNFISSIQGMQGGAKRSPLHQEIFGNVSGDGYAQWFSKRVHFFGVDSCGGPGAVACQMSQYPNKIFVTNNYIHNDFPQIARLMTLYHEARHTEDDQDNWPHAKCPLRFPYTSIWTGARLRGKSACDVTVYGSYGSATIMLENISKFCTNCSDKVKADAAIYADDQAKRLIAHDAIDQMKIDFQYD